MGKVPLEKDTLPQRWIGPLADSFIQTHKIVIVELSYLDR